MVSVWSSSSNVMTAAGVMAFQTSDIGQLSADGDEGQTVLARGVGEALEQVSDAGSDSPVRQQQKYHVGAAGDQWASGGRRGVAQPDCRRTYPLPGLLGDDLMGHVSSISAS